MNLKAKREELEKQVAEIEKKEKVLKERKKDLKSKIREIDEKTKALEREKQIIRNDKIALIVTDLLGDVSSDNISEVEEILREKFAK